MLRARRNHVVIEIMVVKSKLNWVVNKGKRESEKKVREKARRT